MTPLPKGFADNRTKTGEIFRLININQFANYETNSLRRYGELHQSQYRAEVVRINVNFQVLKFILVEHPFKIKFESTVDIDSIAMIKNFGYHLNTQTLYEINHSTN